MITWDKLTTKQQVAIQLAYNSPDRKITSRDIAGTTGRSLVNLGLMVSNQPAGGTYYMPYELTAMGCDVYERGNNKTLPNKPNNLDSDVVNFQPGQKVIWTHEVGGWGWVFRTPATVIKTTPKRVIIEAKRADGSTVQRAVKPESLSVQP